MKIGVVTTSYPRFAGDPAGSFVAAHVAAMRAAGHDVEVIAAGDSSTQDQAASKQQLAYGIRWQGPDESYSDEPRRSESRIPSRLFYRGGAPDALEARHSLGAAAAFTARLCARVAWRARHWDLVVAHWLAPSALAALPARVPLLAIAHGGDVHTLARLHLLGPVLALLRARRAKLAFVSADLLAVARRHGRIDDADVIVQPMGIDADHFAALPRTPTTPPTVLIVARLVPIKGIDVALAAMQLVRRDARLVIAGEGPERERLSRMCGDRVQLIGAVNSAERDRWLCRASALAIPSRVLPNGRTEGMPLIALEALAAGVPVVASAVGGLRDLPGTTRVPPDDPPALAAGLDQLLAVAPTTARVDLANYAWPRVAVRLLEHACVTDCALRSDHYTT